MRILFSLLMLIFLMPSYASHEIGGHITYEFHGNNTVQIEMVLLRQCVGTAPLDSIKTIAVQSSQCGQSTTLTLQRVGQSTITPICPGQSGPCSNPGPNQIHAVEENVYEGTWMKTSQWNCADVEFSYSVCCRDAQNISNPGSEKMHLYAKLDATASPSSNSAQSQSPINPTMGCQTFPFDLLRATKGITDPDGDSLVFELVPCQTSATDTVTYEPGYSSQQPISGAYNSSTVKPDKMQLGAVCYKVSEYRTGSLIGETLYEYNLIIYDSTFCGNAEPVVINKYGIDNEIDTSGQAGTTLTLDFTVYDPDTTQTLLVNCDVNHPDISINCIDSISTDSLLRVELTASHPGEYIFNFSLDDNSCPYSQSYHKMYQIQFQPAVGIENRREGLSGLTVSPNPTSELVEVEFSLSKSGMVTVELLDLSGKVVQEVHSGNLPSGKYSEQLPIKKPGVYLVKVQHQGRVTVRKIVKLSN